MNKLIPAIIIAAVACGCVSVNRNDGGNDNLKPAIVKDVIHTKYTVDNKEVSATDKINCLFGFITWGSSATHTADKAPGGFGMAAKAKNGAYANACDAGKCDELVATRYKVTTEDYFVFARVTAEVKGFPAKVTGVEVIENKDPSTAEKPCTNAAGGKLPLPIPFL